MRTTRSSERYDVFEFNEDDEQIEKDSVKLFKKFGNPNSDDSALTKYDFLQCFARELKTEQKGFSNEPLDVESCNDAFKKRSFGSDAIAPHDFSNYKPTTYSCSEYVDSGCFLSGVNYKARATSLGVTSASSKHLDSALPQFPYDNGPFRINSSDDDCIELSSSSTSGCDTAENEDPLNEQVLEHGFGGHYFETVVVSPDYIFYGDLYCTECLLSFSCCGIKLEGSTVYGIKGRFSFEWAIDDIIKIESRWCRQVETAIVNLHLKSKDAKVAENSDRTSGTVVLEFSDPHWSDIQEAIKSLNMRYKTILDVIFDFGESFEEVIYPKGDPDAVSICKRDIELLQPETFINDTIIDFYIQYLKNKIKPEEKHRFHFFSSFFYPKLSDRDKDPSRACEGREAFQRVCKWTRKVNLFQKDYIFIPVNLRFHWSLIVICHPGEVADFKGEEVGKSPKVPCILHMDSMKGSHRGLKNLIQRYLLEEWKERQREPVEDVSLKFLNLRFVSLELPQQENSFDCGLFLLHYVELFLEQAPDNFNPFRITKFSNFLSKDWFPPAEVSMKRDHIRKLIYEIVEDNSQKVPQAACSDNYPSILQDVNERDTGVEFIGEICNSAETCHGRFEITPSSASPRRGLQGFRESKLVLGDLSKPVVTAGPLADRSYQPFEQTVSLNRFENVMSPVEEGEETMERFAYSPTEEAAGQSFEALRISMHPGEYEDDPVSSEVGVSEIHPSEELVCSSPEGEDKSESSSMSSERLAACVVEDSEEANVVDIVSDSDSENSPSCEEKSLGPSNQKADLKGNNTSAVTESEQKTTKKPRLMLPEIGRRITRKLSRKFLR